MKTKASTKRREVKNRYQQIKNIASRMRRRSSYQANRNSMNDYEYGFNACSNNFVNFSISLADY